MCELLEVNITVCDALSNSVICFIYFFISFDVANNFILFCSVSLLTHRQNSVARAVREQCKVIYSYKPANEDELELKEGELITILSKDLPDKGWWKGELRGKVGVFPDNFVQVIASEGE